MSVYNSSVVGAMLLVLYLSTASNQVYSYTISTTTPTCDVTVCTAYCDVSGNARNEFDCPTDDDDSSEKFCCGDEFNRYCCANSSQAINCRFEEQYMCYSWWIFNWQMALAMLGTVVLLLTVSACCCQCFAHKTNQRAFARAEASAERRRRRGNGDVATIEMEETPPREQVFDPSSLNAFQPPGYAKDPPKYQDIDFGGPSGETNPAFAEDEGINPSGEEILPPPDDDTIISNAENNRQATPPPPYTLYETADNEVDIELSAASISSSPTVIRVSSSPTIVDNTQVEDSDQDSQTISSSPV